MKYLFAGKPRNITLIGLIIAILMLDRWVKWWTLAHLAPLGTPGIDVVPNILRLIYVENRGVAYGFFAHNTFILGIVSTLVILFILWKARHWFSHADVVARTAVALVVAGGIGNIYDRFAYDFVVDMLHLIPLPIFQVFNIADMAISFGAVFLFISMWREDAAKRREAQASSEIA